MSHSLLRASPQTHIKIVVVALVGAILAVMAGIAAHVNTSRSIARMQVHAPVVHAGKPVSFTDQGRPIVR
jgi:hypothetical protein